MLIVDAVLLLGMVGLAVFGAATLPPGAQVPIHFGLGSYNNWMPKKVGLVLWPAIGVLAYVVLVITERRPHHGGATTGLTIALVVILVTQTGALRAAVGRSGRR